MALGRVCSNGQPPAQYRPTKETSRMATTVTAALPPPHGGTWPRTAAEAAGFDPSALKAAIAFAQSHETPWRRDIQAQLEANTFEPPPDNEILGPTAPRGDPNGLILR